MGVIIKLRNFLLGSFLFLFAATSCSAASSKGSSNTNSDQEKLQKEIDSLRQEIEDIKLVLKHAARMDIDEVAPMVREQLEAEKKIHDIPVANSPVSGPANAKVTIVEFTDFQCPYCALRAEDVRKLQEAYPNDIRVVFKHFILGFHREAPAAHAAAMAAQKQGKFWEFRYALSPHYRDLSEAVILKAAKDVGLNIDQFKKDMLVDNIKKATFQRDMDLGTKVGVRGTPTFFINGKLAKDFSFDKVSKLLKD